MARRRARPRALRPGPGRGAAPVGSPPRETATLPWSAGLPHPGAAGALQPSEERAAFAGRTDRPPLMRGAGLALPAPHAGRQDHLALSRAAEAGSRDRWPVPPFASGKRRGSCLGLQLRRRSAAPLRRGAGCRTGDGPETETRPRRVARRHALRGPARRRERCRPRRAGRPAGRRAKPGGLGRPGRAGRPGTAGHHVVGSQNTGKAVAPCPDGGSGAGYVPAARQHRGAPLHSTGAARARAETGMANPAHRFARLASPGPRTAFAWASSHEERPRLPGSAAQARPGRKARLPLPARIAARADCCLAKGRHRSAAPLPTPTGFMAAHSRAGAGCRTARRRPAGDILLLRVASGRLPAMVCYDYGAALPRPAHPGEISARGTSAGRNRRPGLIIKHQTAALPGPTRLHQRASPASDARRRV